MTKFRRRGRPCLPRDDSYVEICRYIMQAAPADYSSLPFIASLYTYAVNHGGLTNKQLKHLDAHCRLFLKHPIYIENGE